MNLPLMWLGIGYAPICLASDGLPTFLSSAYGHSQPLPMNEPTLALGEDERLLRVRLVAGLVRPGERRRRST